MLKLKLQYFGHLMQRADSLEKTLMLGKIEGKRKRGQQRMRWLDGITNLKDMSLSERTPRDGEGQGSLVCCSPWGRKESDTTERLNSSWELPWNRLIAPGAGWESSGRLWGRPGPNCLHATLTVSSSPSPSEADSKLQGVPDSLLR